MWIVMGVMAQAQTATAWQTEPFWQPRLNGRFVRVNGRQSFQALAGAEVGIRFDHAPLISNDKGVVRSKRDLVGRARLQGDVLYGLSTNATGYALRLGSFIGPTSKAVTYQVGPDVWATQYGDPVGPDYHLPFAVGLDILNLVIFHIDPAVTAQVGIIPGWAFNGPRATPVVGPFHQLSGFAVVSVRAAGFAVNVGVSRRYDVVGVSDSIILTGGL